ncbi:ABC transporter substrate-binding protein [Nocardioides sp. Kera G14]|uniref:ABC transporter substrate-binding protein n=1 Tax=Nocardioides sp. Kera G14 TaxID=2884264 RepID=UPI001D120C22|nr:ABC transporter substrate-binding protein [Nocardioides sp. Kera G14]UDY23035.1 ABC transporter substrate-binding protein [Nocardioides sp. Kera G14]
MNLTLKKTALAAVAATTLLSLAACGGESASAGGSGSTDGGEVTFLIDALNSFKTNSSAWSSFEGNVYRNVFDKLVYVDNDGKVSPWIAESWENNADYTKFTLHLKTGVTFSDGEKLDAAAVAKNLTFWAQGDSTKGIAPVGLFPKTFKSATAVDDATVQVDFSAPTLGFIQTLGYGGTILYAPKTLEGSATDQADLSKEIGSGPYTVKSWKVNDNVVLVKRKDYNWGAAATGNTGPAHLDEITFKVSTDPSVRVAAVQSGQAQIAYNPTPQQISTVKAAGFNVYTPVYLGFSYGWVLNTSVFPLNSTAVRQALQHAIDRDEIIKTVYTPDWKPAISFFNNSVPGVTDVSADFQYDQAQAAALLAKDGWVKDSDGVLAKDGKELELTLYASPYVVATKQVDQLISNQLAKLGIKTKIVAYDVVTYNQKLIGAKDLQIQEQSRSIGDASTAASVFTSADKGEDWFHLGTSDATIAKLRPEIIGATDPDARDKALAELQKYVIDQGYYIPIYQIVQRPLVTSPKLKDIVEDSTTFVGFNNATLSE